MRSTLKMKEEDLQTLSIGVKRSRDLYGHYCKCAVLLFSCVSILPVFRPTWILSLTPGIPHVKHLEGSFLTSNACQSVLKNKINKKQKKKEKPTCFAVFDRPSSGRSGDMRPG